MIHNQGPDGLEINRILVYNDNDKLLECSHQYENGRDDEGKEGGAPDPRTLN